MLNNEQQMLLTEFYDQENVVAQLKNNLNIVNSIQPLTILEHRIVFQSVRYQLYQQFRRPAASASSALES